MERDEIEACAAALAFLKRELRAYPNDNDLSLSVKVGATHTLSLEAMRLSYDPWALVLECLGTLRREIVGMLDEKIMKVHALRKP